MRRRSFIQSIPPLITLPMWRSAPDVILYNGNIISVDPQQPKAQAVAIVGDQIMAVGSNDEIRRLANGFTKKIDLEGSTVTPGFIDAHSHPASAHWHQP